MKRTLQEIKAGTGITTKAIAEKADLPTGDVHVVLIGGSASWALANKVVRAFNELSRMDISVLDISFVAPPNDYDLPLLYDLWKRYRFSSAILAEKAGVDEQIILRMIGYKEVKRETAEKVLAALSRLVNQEYTLENVRIELDHEEIRNARKQK